MDSYESPDLYLEGGGFDGGSTPVVVTGDGTQVHTFDFSESLSYDAGTVVRYQGSFFVFNIYHPAGVWNPEHATPITTVRMRATTQPFNILPDYNLSSPLGPSKYKVRYLPNNDSINFPERFVVDTNVYLPGDMVTVLNYPYAHYSEDGVWLYTFIGWSLGKGINPIGTFNTGTFLMPPQDITLYAQWAKECTLDLVHNNQVLVKLQHRQNITKLVIPEYLGGVRIKEIATYGFQNSTITEVVVPTSITRINAYAFSGWTGSRLRFTDGTVTHKYPALELKSDCFVNTPNLVELLLPYRWQKCLDLGSEELPKRLMDAELGKSGVVNVYIRNTKAAVAEYLAIPFASVEDRLFGSANPSMLYDRNIYWGYND